MIVQVCVNTLLIQRNEPAIQVILPNGDRSISRGIEIGGPCRVVQYDDTEAHEHPSRVVIECELDDIREATP